MATKKHLLSPSEKAALAEEKAELNETIDAMSKGHGKNIDVAAMKRQRDHYDQMIHDGSAGRMTGATKDKLSARAKELEGQFTSGMPTRDEMWAKRGEHPGIVRKQMGWEKRNAGSVQEWKQIQRRLEPDNPTASNIERFRK